MSTDNQSNEKNNDKDKTETQNDPTESQAASDDQPAQESEVTVENLQDDLNKWKTEYLYLKAEFDNFKKRSIKERSDLIKFGSERLIVQLLEVMDNFERALETEVNPDNLNSFKTGVQMTASELQKVLEQFGVEAVESQGVAFDPSLHEALSSEESAEIEPGHITRVFKKPYKLHDRVIRPGQVVVAKEPSDKE